MSKKISVNQNRKLQFEQFEQRLVMSAQAVGSLLPELDIASPAITQQEVVYEDAGTQAHEASQIAAEFGFDGSGQTVAVIDSGIAWDHYALGNGYGEGNKVVGGWDFAENDANPYDDGPAGFHGTHVAGIIGSTDAQYTGIAPGADLVGLRVFGDNGEGNLEWVEQALQWVHEHKDDFENPITTVNLSLGTNWNGDDLPDWASLEDEFALLEADGLFISVAAGNGFRTIGEAGLSYPAVSDHVVPVASHDAEGNLSEFSQRDEGVLVAPGELLRSTAPDHVFVGSKTGQFLGSTGTSMAAPYVAGASTILRQANEFMGVENITQDLLYQQFMDSADQIYDSVTGGYYHRLNLESALQSVIQDLHSSATETATDAGTIGGGETIEGTIGRLADVDTFEFTAAQSGRMTLDFTATDDLEPLVEVIGNQSTVSGNQISLSVVAGQKYQLSVASSNGNGHYKIDFALESDSEFETTNLGEVVSSDFVGQQINGESLYEVTNVRAGILTIQANAELASNQSLRVEIYDDQMNLLGSSQIDRNGQTRFDFEVGKSEQLFVKAIGQANSIDLSFDNLVALNNGVLSIHGTNADDVISVSTTGKFAIDINGIEYEFDHSSVKHINVNGHNGNDRFEAELGHENDKVATYANGMFAANENFGLSAREFSTVSVDAGSGYDAVSMIDSAQHETLTSHDSDSGFTVSLESAARQSSVTGFDLVYIGSTGGNDTAVLNGTHDNDVYISRGTNNVFRAAGTNLVFNNFSSVRVNGGGGHDMANLNATGNEQLALNPDSATVTSETLSVAIDGFSRINAFSTSDNASVTLNDTSGADVFDYRSERAIMFGEGYLLFAHGFSDVDAVSSGGVDIAQVYDTQGNDIFYSRAGNTELVSDQASVATHDFKIVNLVANQGGFDRAVVTGTDGADALHADQMNVRIVNSNGQSNRIQGVEESTIDMGDGFDLAYLTGSEHRESLTGSYDDIEFETTLQLLRLTNAEYTHFDGNGGGDEVHLEELDLLESLGDQAKAYLQDRVIEVEDFAILEARSVDEAIADYTLEAVDYLYMLRGKWAKKF